MNPLNRKIHKNSDCNELTIKNKMFTERQRSPSTGKAFFFSGADAKVRSRGWQASRLNSKVKFQRTFQFENNKVIIQSIGIICESSICIPNYLGNVSDLI